MTAKFPIANVNQAGNVHIYKSGENQPYKTEKALTSTNLGDYLKFLVNSFNEETWVESEDSIRVNWDDYENTYFTATKLYLNGYGNILGAEVLGSDDIPLHKHHHFNINILVGTTSYNIPEYINSNVPLEINAIWNITINGVALDSSEYTINYDTGILTFNFSVDQPCTACVYV